jgi:hypothetical protein
MAEKFTSVGDRWAFGGKEWYNDKYSTLFRECVALHSISIPPCVTSIRSHAFYRCVSLTSVSIPDSVRYIGANSFEYCSSLTSIIIPDSVVSIGKRAFAGCGSLKYVSIPNKTTVESGAFQSNSIVERRRLRQAWTAAGAIVVSEGGSLPTIWPEAARKEQQNTQTYLDLAFMISFSCFLVKAMRSVSEMHPEDMPYFFCGRKTASSTTISLPW